MKKHNYDPIANIDLLFERSTGEHVSVSIEIGSPYINDQGVWACPTEMDGLYSRSDVCGEDSFQSLCLALSLIHKMITYFIQDGGRVLCALGEVLPIDAYFSPFRHV
jgi:hypothetical protein